jgi:hypothetical protein
MLLEEFGVSYKLTGVYKLLHRLGFSSLMPRAKHPGSSDEEQDDFLKKTLPQAYSAVCEKVQKSVELWLQDEARFGQQGTLTRVWAERGTRPRAYRQTKYEWAYLFDSACPATGDAHGCLLPAANRDAREQYLANFSRHLNTNVHVLLVLEERDGTRAAGCKYRIT